MKYKPITAVNVFIDLGDKLQKVGRLQAIKRDIYFEYDAEFLTAKLEISPIHLPLKIGIGAVAAKPEPFEGLFGVFSDSLPDGWGRLLLDRQVKSSGVPPEKLTALDRLSHVGNFGMGALAYEPDRSEAPSKPPALDLQRLAEESRIVLEGENDEVFADLLAMSGSSAGARPKVMIGVSSDRKQLIHGRQTLPDDFEHWMIKFASRGDRKDCGAIEYAYSLMARDAGLDMTPTHLFPATSKNEIGYFGVKRFDRVGNERLHMHSLAGFIGADYTRHSLDYEHVLKATLSLTHHAKQVESMFRLSAFNVFAHNRDDHAKNFAFLMDAHGVWRIAPAYDLTFSAGPNGEHSTTIVGEGRNPTTEHLLQLAKRFSIKDIRAKQIIDQIRDATSRWPSFASEGGVSKTSTRDIRNALIGIG
jgi:serine/threonine-protein kinase HipA